MATSLVQTGASADSAASSWPIGIRAGLMLSGILAFSVAAGIMVVFSFSHRLHCISESSDPIWVNERCINNGLPWDDQLYQTHLLLTVFCWLIHLVVFLFIGRFPLLANLTSSAICLGSFSFYFQRLNLLELPKFNTEAVCEIQTIGEGGSPQQIRPICVLSYNKQIGFLFTFLVRFLIFISIFAIADLLVVCICKFGARRQRNPRSKGSLKKLVDNLDFELGIDGLNKEMRTILREAILPQTVPETTLKNFYIKLRGILLYGAPDRIDRAFHRPGRFELQLKIDKPDEISRQEILEIHTSKLRKNGMLGSEVDLKAIAKRTPGFSGDELIRLVNSAKMSALNRYVQHGGESKVLPIDFRIDMAFNECKL